MLRVHRLAAAIDMIAAGTNAPITIAANATPANHGENSCSNSCGIASCGFLTWIPAATAAMPSSASRPSRNEYAGSSAALRRMMLRFLVDSTAVTECGYMNSASAEPSDSVAYAHWETPESRDQALRTGLAAGDRVGVVLVERVERLAGRVEDAAPAAQLRRQVDHRDDDDEVDQRVLDERDQRGRAEPRRVRVGRQQRERDEQRNVLAEPAGVLAAAEAHDVEHRLDADELQRDVGQRRQDAGERDRERQPTGVEPALHEVGRRDVRATVRDRPQARQEDEDDRVQDDRVGHGEESRGIAGIQQRRHRDERVGRVDVAADQEPGDERAEAASAEPPLVEVVERLGLAPPCGEEAQHGDQQEEEQEDAEGDRIDVVHRSSPFVRPSARRRLRSWSITSL